MPPKAASPAPGQTPYGIFKKADLLYHGERTFSRKRQEEWLRRSKTWDGLDSSVWKAKRVLGVGGNGIVGQWEYHGTDANMPKNIVIKQGSDSQGMGWESRLLKILGATGSDHFVKLYKANFRARGTGTSQRFDDIPFDDYGYYDPSYEVNRLYIEFCEKGDLDGYTSKFEKLIPAGVYPPEEYTGSEDPDTPDPNFVYPIAHFDIKRTNVLVGERDATEHSRFNIMKLADFGLALPVPLEQVRRGTNWIKESQWRATHDYMSPEQLYPDHSNRDISHQTNIWATGAVMHDLIYGRPPLAQKFTHTLTNPSSGTDVTITVQGNLLLTPVSQGPNGKRIYLPYSRLLIDTILYCLAFDPSYRLSAADLIKRTQSTLAVYEQMHASATTAVPNAPLATVTPTAAPSSNAGPAPNAPPTTVAPPAAPIHNAALAATAAQATSAFQSLNAIRAQLAAKTAPATIPPPTTDPRNEPAQPNIQPKGYPLLGQNPPTQRPLPNLRAAGKPATYQAVGVGLFGPDPVNPALLFPAHKSAVPASVLYKDYPHHFMPDSP
ncbi:kinase-like protein [Stipitochalara longipes BDJ]|nr:kinase-like protein [Stipitochalara longipes BDJ]